jgi:hypothetical protein
VDILANSDLRGGLTGDERAILYRFAYETGIRPGQIRALTVADFALDANPPTVTTQARFVKRRRVHVQQLRPSLAADLKKRFASKLPAAPAFKMPSEYHMAEMLRADLKTARDKWIEEAPEGEPRLSRGKSDFLADVNHAGERAVFYSMRHSHGTALAEAGVPEKDIAASMHHASRTTTARYMHSDRAALSLAIGRLPELSIPARQIATGTDGAPRAVADVAKKILRKPCAAGTSKLESNGVNAGLASSHETAGTIESTGASAILPQIQHPGLLAELADAVDSKSTARKGISLPLR